MKMLRLIESAFVPVRNQMLNVLKNQIVFLLIVLLLLPGCCDEIDEPNISIDFELDHPIQGVQVRVDTHNWCAPSRIGSFRAYRYQVFIKVDERPFFMVDDAGRLSDLDYSLPDKTALRDLVVKSQIKVMLSPDRKHLVYESNRLGQKIMFDFLPKGPGFRTSQMNKKILMEMLTETNSIQWNNLIGPEQTVFAEDVIESAGISDSYWDDYYWEAIASNPENEKIIELFWLCWHTVYGYGDGETYWKPLWKTARQGSGVSEEWRKELSRKIKAALDKWDAIYKDRQFVRYDADVIIACLADIKSPNRKRAIDLIMKDKAYPTHYNIRFPINLIKDYVTDEEMRLLSKKFFDEIGVKKPGDKKPEKLGFFKRLWSEIKKHKKLHGY